MNDAGSHRSRTDRALPSFSSGQNPCGCMELEVATAVSPERTKAPCDLKAPKYTIRTKKHRRFENPFAPSASRSAKRFARRYFVGRFAGGLQFCTRSRAHNQHVPKLGQIGFVAQRAMPRNESWCLLSAKGRTLSAATIIPSIFPRCWRRCTG